jgi:hypothetical protein
MGPRHTVTYRYTVWLRRYRTIFRRIGRCRRGDHNGRPGICKGTPIYHSTRGEEIAIIKASGHDPVLRHTGDYRRVIDRHERQIEQLYRAKGPDGLRSVWPMLMARICDERTPRNAIAKLDRNKAPGPSGLRLENQEPAEFWSLSRELRRMIERRTYRPGPETKRKIPKVGKPGQYRIITVQSTEDRIVAKAVQLILQSLMEVEFAPFSVGFRPLQGRLNGLAIVLALLRQQKRSILVVHSI